MESPLMDNDNKDERHPKDDSSTLAEPLLNDVQHDSTTAQTAGTVQPPAYRDVGFAIAFYIHLLLVLILAAMMRPSLVVEYDNQHDRRMLGEEEDDDITARQVLLAIVWVLVVAITSVLLLLTGAMHLMVTYPISLIQGTLVGSIGVPAVLGFVLLVTGSGFAALPPLLMAALLLWYAHTIWNRIPYAAANVKTALSALQSQHANGVTGMSLGSVASWTAWIVLWGSASTGVGTAKLFWTTTSHEASDESEEEQREMNMLGMVAVAFLVLSNYWVGQVIKNVLRTTIAGVVGTWWFDANDNVSTTPSASCCCSTSPTVTDSLHRSTTYSFGSICFGSLVVAILHTIREGLRSAQSNGRVAEILSCVLEFLVFYVEKLVEYCNKWSFIYVGLYGYGYIDASKKVMSLFQERNWMPVVADDLVNRLLGIVSLTVSILAALLCFLLSRIVYHNTTSMAIITCVMGFVLAIFLSNLLVGIISSAVDTIIVCYAEAPVEFQRSHPVLAEEMESAWKEAWRDPQSGLILISLGSGPGLL